MSTVTEFVFTGVPSSFRASCRSASAASTAQRTAWSYLETGRQFGESISRLVPDSFEPDEDWPEWLEKNLDQELEKGAAAGFAWILEHYPRCAALIPRRRQARFMFGFVRTYRDGEFDTGSEDE